MLKSIVFREQKATALIMCIRQLSLVHFLDWHCTTVRLPTQNLLMRLYAEPGIQLHENLPTFDRLDDS